MTDAIEHPADLRDVSQDERSAIVEAFVAGRPVEKFFHHLGHWVVLDQKHTLKFRCGDAYRIAGDGQ